MTDSAGIEVRPACRRDAAAIADFLTVAPPGPGDGDRHGGLLLPDLANHVVAVSGSEIAGACRFIAGAGRCAVIPPPRLREWDESLASRLLRAVAVHARTRHRARLIQSLVPPDDATPLSASLLRAGFDRLAVLSYMRRPVTPQDRDLAPPPDLTWHRYSRFRHRRFAHTIALTYEASGDCPRLAGLRTVDDAIATHKGTGRFSPRTWRTAVEAGRPVGVGMVNAVQGRGELVYLGVVREARRRGIGRALLGQAIRDTAGMGLPQMGLAVDVSNTPAVRLYEQAGFTEIRRRTAYFIPRDVLDSLAE